MDTFVRIGLYALLLIFMVIFIISCKKKYPLISLKFLVFMLIYRLPFIFVYFFFIPGDWMIYYDKAASAVFYHEVYSFGTDSIYYFTRPLVLMGLEPIDLFFIFSLFGYVGITFFYIIGHKLINYTDKVFVWGINIFPWILLYPSLHMFTVMLGKDPLVLMGIAFIGYSLTFLTINKSFLILGLLILLFVRPHIMFVIMLSLGVSLIWSFEWGRIRKFLFMGICVILGSMLLPVALQFFRVTEFSLEAIEMAIKLNAGYGDDSTTFIDMTGYPFPLKMFTYLFRPLFLDASNAMLMVYSFENMIFLFLTISIIRVTFFQWINDQPRIIKFSLIFTLLGTLVLSNGLSVFGLFMRQKTMVFLFLLLIIFAFIHHRNQKKIYRIKPANPELPPSHA